MTLTKKQEKALWSLFVKATQGEFGVLYDEDHEFDEEREMLIKVVNEILEIK